MQLTTGNMGMVFGVTHQGQLSAQEMAAMMAMYGVTDSLQILDQGNKTLGGKQFSFLDFKRTGATVSDSTSRARVYFLSQGNFLFEGLMIYDTKTVATGIADYEGALATLNITANTGIRPVAVRSGRKAGAFHDALGRSFLPLPSLRHALPIYSRN